MVKRVVLWSAWLLLTAAVALADGEGPQRRPTPAEAQALGELRTAIEESLPGAPVNCTAQFSGPATSAGEFTLPQAIPPDGMLRMTFQKVYTLDPSVVRATFVDRSKGTPEEQARLAALDAKVGELVDARDRSRDAAEKKRLRAEIQETEAEADALRDKILSDYQQWIASGQMMAAIQESLKVQPSHGLVMRVLVNGDAFIAVQANNIGIPASKGLTRVYEEDHGCDGVGDSYCYTVLLGPFEEGDPTNGQRRHALVNPTRGVPTQARGMVITVSGTKDAREATALLRATDLQRLESLL